MKTKRLETPYGWIDYHYEISEKYPKGLLILMGGYINMAERGHGRYTEILSDLFNMMPMDTIVQASVAHQGLIPMFKRLGFKKVKRIEYWGERSYPIEGKIEKK